MIDIFIRSVLGPTLSKVLDFYLEYSLWINGAILLYAATVVWGRRTYKNILAFIGKDLLASQPDLCKHNAETIRRIINNIEIPWQSALNKSPSPLISRPGSWLVYPKTLSNLRKLMDTTILAHSLADPTNEHKKS